MKKSLSKIFSAKKYMEYLIQNPAQFLLWPESFTSKEFEAYSSTLIKSICLVWNDCHHYEENNVFPKPAGRLVCVKNHLVSPSTPKSF